MSPKFNLIYEPWIPCITLDGQSVELGLRETLARAHELREILDNSPLVTASLYRLLLAIVHRNFGPHRKKEWAEIWRQGRFDGCILDAYWKKWESRFDLFHPERPFYQSRHKEVLGKEPDPPARLAHELASGNNDTLWDHSFESSPRPISAGRAARLLVAIQNYALGGGVSKPFNFEHAPLVSGILVLMHGENLFESLWLNALVQTRDRPIPSSQDDCPCWEYDRPRRGERRVPRGYLDLLTWQSRRVLLEVDPQGNVCRVRFRQGDALEKDVVLDPLMVVKARDEKKGFQLLRFSQDRALWRDCHALLAESNESKEKGGRPTLPILQAASVREEHGVPEKGAAIDVFGLCNNQAKVFFWRHERIPLPIKYLDDKTLHAMLREALDKAEKVADLLKDTINNLARNLLYPPLAGGEPRKPDREKVNSLARSLPSLPHYWSTLEPRFYEFFVQLPRKGKDALTDWFEILRRTALNAFDLAIRGLDSSARSLQAATMARRILTGRIGKIIPKRREVTINEQASPR